MIILSLLREQGGSEGKVRKGMPINLRKQKTKEKTLEGREAVL